MQPLPGCTFLLAMGVVLTGLVFLSELVDDVRFCDRRQRNLERGAAVLEANGVALDAAQDAAEATTVFPVHRNARLHAHFFAGVLLEVTAPRERAVEARRADLEAVANLRRDGLVHVERDREVLADVLTVGERDTAAHGR